MDLSKSTLGLRDVPGLTYDHSEANIQALIQDVSKTPGATISYNLNPEECISRSSTPHSPAPPGQTPRAIFFPKSTADVSALLKACHARSIAVTAFAGGTSLGGALTATRGGICIDFSGMNSIGEVHEADMDVAVGPGVGWVELNDELERRGTGLWFPVDPARGAMVGGMIAMGCSGTNAYRYGTVKNWVVGLTVVLADGSVVVTRKRPRKSSAGYDLTSLVIGSEGTLGLVTEAVLRLAPVPQNLWVGLMTFASMQEGVDAAAAILRSGHVLEAIELMDAPSVKAINHSGYASQHLDEVPSLFLKFAGSQRSVQDQIDFARKLGWKDKFEVSNEKEHMEAIWGARKCLGNALVTMKKDPSDLFLHTDSAVPISQMARLVEESERIVRAEGADWFCASVGHVGDGNVHTAIVCPASARAAAERLCQQIQRLALELEGTITGEHGIGLKLRDLLSEEVGEDGVGVMRKIKFALDPKGILNPDKVVRLQADIRGSL